MAVSAREVALDILLRCEKDGGYANLALDAALSRTELSSADRGLVTELVFGVIERKITLDHYITKLSSAKLCDVEPRVLMLIRMALYQLAFLDRIPAYAAVNESVSLCPKRAKGYVNAILRSFMRLDAPIALPDDPVERLSVEYSYPTALCELFSSEFGYERARSLFAAMNENPKPTLRVNTLKTDREAVISALEKEGIKAEKSLVAPNGLTMSGGAVATLSGLREGEFFVQDEASQICCEALGAVAGDFVIDVCAAPGSKSFGAAINMENKGRVLSCDLHKNKLSLIEKGAKKLGIDIIEARAADGRVGIEELFGKADKVICDVPCSGYGVIAKKPEIRYKDPKETERLPEIQYDILESCSRYVKEGGVLVYSTCTVLHRENGANIERFLNAHKDFYAEDYEVCGKKYGAITTFMPDTDKTDGFFVARLRKNGK